MVLDHYEFFLGGVNGFDRDKCGGKGDELSIGVDF